MNCTIPAGQNQFQTQNLLVTLSLKKEFPNIKEPGTLLAIEPMFTSCGTCLKTFSDVLKFPKEKKMSYCIHCKCKQVNIV